MISKCTLATSLAVVFALAGLVEAGGPGCGMQSGRGGMMKGGSGCCMKMGGASSNLKTVGDLAAQLQLSQAMLTAQSQALVQRQLVAQIQTMAAQSDADVHAGLSSVRSETRLASAYIVGEKGLPYADELITLVTDRDPLVRQAARRSLMLLSYQIDAAKKANREGAKAKAVDFGPIATAPVSSAVTSAKKWKVWMDQNNNDRPKRLFAVDAAK